MTTPMTNIPAGLHAMTAGELREVIAARDAELAAMKQGKALADGMANMIRGFILKTVERETLDESAAKYRKWEEDYCHSDFTKLNRDEWKRKPEEAARDSARLDWMIEHGTDEGGGSGFEFRVYIQHDSECLRDAIDVDIAAKGGA